MELSWAIGILGWALAMLQFAVTYRRNKQNDDYELLERTLGYFEKNAISRSIGISLVQDIWLKENKHINIITPVIVAQLIHIMFETDSDSYGVEERNAIRMLYLLWSCFQTYDDLGLQTYDDIGFEALEISEALISKVGHKGGVRMGKSQLRHWYKKFNSGLAISFDAETEGYEDS
jgi:hypothetical protein